jgi:hypothetical protein
MMIKIAWISNKLFKDIIKHRKGILQYVGLMTFILLLGKGMKSIGLLEWYLPVTLLIVVLLGIYLWYDTQYNWEQKQLMEKLKEEKK